MRGSSSRKFILYMKERGSSLYLSANCLCYYRLPFPLSCSLDNQPFLFQINCCLNKTLKQISILPSQMSQSHETIFKWLQLGLAPRSINFMLWSIQNNFCWLRETYAHVGHFGRIRICDLSNNPPEPLTDLMSVLTNNSAAC